MLGWIEKVKKLEVFEVNLWITSILSLSPMGFINEALIRLLDRMIHLTNACSASFKMTSVALHHFLSLDSRQKSPIDPDSGPFAIPHQAS